MSHIDRRIDGARTMALLREIDPEARRLGVTRQAFIEVRLADALPKGN